MRRSVTTASLVSVIVSATFAAKTVRRYSPPAATPEAGHSLSQHPPLVGALTDTAPEVLPDSTRVTSANGTANADSVAQSAILIESTEFVDQDIQDALRAIARAYNLNIFAWPEVKGKVNVTLHKMPVGDALRNLVEPLGFELAWENRAWQVRAPRPVAQGNIDSVHRDTVSLSVRNQDVRRFADEYARRTSLNLLVDRNAKGDVSGTLRGVTALEGLKAILTANGFELRSEGDAWIISTSSIAGQDPNGGMPMGRGNRANLSVRKGLVTANLRMAQLTDVVQTLADQSGYNMITYGQLGGTVDANLKDVPVMQALEYLLQGTPFTFAMQDSIMLIGDRNPGSASGQALSSTEIYYLKHARVDKVLALIPKNLPAMGLQAVPELNALLLSGTSESNAKVKDFLATIDQEAPQVVIEAIIVEFYRGNSSEFGIQQSSLNKDASSVTGPALVMRGTGKTSTASVTGSFGPFSGTVGLLPQDFLVQLKAVENSDKGRILARPRLTTLNGQTASINVGNSDYFQVVTTDKDGVASSDYRVFNSGITLSITPYLTRSGEITAEIKPEIRTPRSTTGSNTDKPPSTSTRSLSTNVRLRDGETLVLGGLIQTVDLDNIQGVPLLSAIPILGRLFTFHSRTKQTTELAIFITPRVQKDSLGAVDPKAAIGAMDKRIHGLVKLPEFLGGPGVLPPTPENATRKAPETEVKAMPE